MKNKKIYLVTKGITKAGVFYAPQSRIALTEEDAHQFGDSLQLILSENARTFVDEVVPEVAKMTSSEPKKKRGRKAK